jgi:hypothetical protein
MVQFHPQACCALGAVPHPRTETIFVLYSRIGLSATSEVLEAGVLREISIELVPDVDSVKEWSFHENSEFERFRLRSTHWVKEKRLSKSVPFGTVLIADP